jgi:hypothetical protein
MSFMAADTLLPRAEQSTEHRRWTGMPMSKRETWLAQLREDTDVKERVWSGEFDVERRPSWQSRNSDRWSDDYTLKKLERRDTLRENQLAQIDGYLITREILEYHFEGTGTDDDPYLVTWIENDIGNPLNFSASKKWMNALLLACAVFMVSIASSGFSQGMAHTSF